MSIVWFTADPHLGGHRLVAEKRGFDCPEQHDAAIADRWRAVVRPGDQVWVLGDIAVNNPAVALMILAGLPGRKHLILGNHDTPHSMHRSSHNHQAAYLAVFDSVQLAARRRIGGQDVLLSHFPYTADREETRYPQWRLPDLGAWLLHGHTHLPEVRTGPREIHVGVDAWGLTPVNLDTIATMIRETEESEQ